MDLAASHYKALQYLRKGNKSYIFNLGNSAKEVIYVVITVT